MKTIRITPARHDTSGKLINNKDLIVFYYVVLITEHEIIGTQRQLHVMLDLQIFRISQVLDLEELFYFLNSIRCQMNNLIFLIDDEISGFLNFLTHDSIHLGKFLTCLSSFQRMCHIITQLIELCGFSTLSGNNQRCSRLINQNRVNLIDDGVMQFSLYQLLFINHHIITQIIET